MTQASPAIRRAAQRSWVPMGLLAVACAWSALWFVHARGCWDDAAYAHLEFARALSRGHGFQFAGQQTYGDSAPLWVWLLAGFHAVLRNWMVAGEVLTTLVAGLALAGAFAYGRALTRDLGRIESGTFSAAMVLLLALNPVFDRWAFVGMPCIGATALALWGLAMATRRPDQPADARRVLTGCACAGFAPLLRPEMLIFTPLLGSLLFVGWVNMPLGFRPKLQVFFAGVALTGVPVIAWIVYAARTFGTAVPNGYAASVGGPHESVLLELMRGYALGFPVACFGVLALAGWYLRMRMRRDEVRREQGIGRKERVTAAGWLPFIWAGATCAFFAAHHAHVDTRLLLAEGGALSIAVLAMVHQRWPRAYVPLLGAAFAIGALTSARSVWPLLSAVAQRNAAYAQLAGYIRTLPAQQAVAAEHSGELAFLSEHPVVDMSGLMRADALDFRWDGSDARRVWWVHERGARFLLLGHPPEPNATAVWSADMPPERWVLDFGAHSPSEKLTLWRLPTSPTLPVPADMPKDDGL